MNLNHGSLPMVAESVQEGVREREGVCDEEGGCERERGRVSHTRRVCVCERERVSHTPSFSLTHPQGPTPNTQVALQKRQPEPETMNR